MAAGPQTLVRMGQVVVNVQDPRFSWKRDSGGMGRGVSIAGIMAWTAAQTLSEMYADERREVSVAGASGVLERFWFEGVLVGPYRGWYLGHFTIDVEYQWSLNGVTGPVPFSFDGTFFGGRRPVVTLTNSDPGNSFALVPEPLAVDPLWASDPAGGQLLVPAGGRTFSREYDEATSRVVGRNTEPRQA